TCFRPPTCALRAVPTRRSSDLGPLGRGAYEPGGGGCGDLRRAHPGIENAPLAEIARFAHPQPGTNVGKHSIGESLGADLTAGARSEEHTSELQSRFDLVCRLLL